MKTVSFYELKKRIEQETQTPWRTDELLAYARRLRLRRRYTQISYPVPRTVYGLDENDAEILVRHIKRHSWKAKRMRKDESKVA